MSSSSWAEWLYFNGRTTDRPHPHLPDVSVGPPAAGRWQAAGRCSFAARARRAREARTPRPARWTKPRCSRMRQTSTDRRQPRASRGLELPHHPRVSITITRWFIGRAKTPRPAGDVCRSADRRACRERYRARDHSAAVVVPDIHSRQWRLGISYVVPVLSGALRGNPSRRARDDRACRCHRLSTTITGDFGRELRWQWGQVAHDDVSIVYGRVFPPSDGR